MKKSILLFISALFLNLFSVHADEWTENFDDQHGNSYITGTTVMTTGTWSSKDAGNFSYCNSNMGSYGFTINDDKSGAYITTPLVNSIGTLSFKYAFIYGRADNTFQVQLSEDGTNFSTLDTHILGESSNKAWVNYSITINNSSSTVYLRILSDNQNAHLFIDDFSVTNFSGSSNQSPSISNITQTPNEDITSSSTISVAADVADADGTVSTVELHWGTTSGSLSNIIVMSNGGSGDTYTTSSNIPAQANGTTVYYEIYAKDNENAEKTSSEQSYHIVTPLTTTLPYSENFDSDLSGVYIKNIAGVNVWSYSSGTAKGNGHNGDNPEEDWMILPGLNLDNYSNEELSFTTYLQYGTIDENNYLKLYYSLDYPGLGNPASYSWTELSFNKPASATSSEVETSSGAIDLSSIAGSSVYIAFKYYSTDSPSAWSIDNISIEENQTLSEPTNHVTGFSASVNSHSQITLIWTDASGGQVPEGYLIKAAIDPATATAPVDGSAEAEAALVKNITQGTQTAVFSGLNENTTYNFSIYPFTNSGDLINYKTDGTVSTTSATTEIYVAPSNHTENFDNCTVGGSYSDGSFVGVDDITWTYVASRDENGDANSSGIDGSALMLRRSDEPSKITSSTISSGIGNFSVKLYKGFTGGGNRQVELFVNGVSKGLSTEFDDYNEHLFEVNNINVTGDVVIEIRNVTAKHVIVDDIYWTNFNLITTNWTGATDSDWATASNWDNGVPTSTSIAVIPSDEITNFPVISAVAECYNLSLSSDATLLGAENLTINGTANIKRFLSEDAWQYLTPPISNATANDFEITTEGENAFLIEYDNSVADSGDDSELGWNYITSDETNLTAGKGYGVFVTDAKEIEFKGDLVTGDQSITNLVKNSESENPWILIGNTALANLDWTAVANDADITGSAYVYTKQNGYGTINSDGTVVPSSGSKYIPSMQGFFVEASSSADDETISFPTSALSNESQEFYKSEIIRSNFVRLGIQKGNFIDETVVYFKDDAINDYDFQSDSHKKLYLTDAHPQFYTLSNDEKLVINTLEEWPVTVPIAIKSNLSEELKLKTIDVDNLDENLVVLLEDKLTEQTYNISTGLEIEINVESGENLDRFFLHFANAASSDAMTQSSKMNVYAINHDIYFDHLTSSAQINIYSTNGKKLVSETINQTQKVLSPNLRKGLYIVKVITAKNRVNTFKVNIK